jgi:hypothetical protein
VYAQRFEVLQIQEFEGRKGGGGMTYSGTSITKRRG